MSLMRPFLAIAASQATARPLALALIVATLAILLELQI